MRVIVKQVNVEQGKVNHPVKFSCANHQCRAVLYLSPAVPTKTCACGRVYGIYYAATVWNEQPYDPMKPDV